MIAQIVIVLLIIATAFFIYKRNKAKKLPSSKLGWYIIASFVVIVIIAQILFNSNTTTTSIPPHGIVYNSEYDGSVSQAERYLKEHLRDPSSYDPMDWSRVVDISGANEKYPSAKWMVRHKYRAKNGFGGLNIENTVFYLDASGNVLGSSEYGK